MKRTYGQAFSSYSKPYNKKRKYNPPSYVVPDDSPAWSVNPDMVAPKPRLSSLRLFRPSGEKKGMDTDLTTVSVISSTNTNANIIVLNLVQQGNGSWNRVGRKTHLDSVRIKGAVIFASQPSSSTGVMAAPSFRYVLVWDKQPSGGAIPTFDTIFGITAQDGTESCPDVTCPLKYDNMDRFVVLKDCYLTAPPNPINATGSGPSITVNVGVDDFIRLNRLESVYSGQSNPMTIADISTGALYFVMRSQLVGNSGVTVDAIARVRYSD